MDSAVLLVNPKYPNNVGSVIRACSIFGVPWLRWTGGRINKTKATAGQRLPREERMKDYLGVDWREDEKALEDFLNSGLTPVAVEFGLSESLPEFEHPQAAVYIFGPEDGSIPPRILSQCHRFVRIPSGTRTPLNLAMAVNIILYDRFVKLGSKEYILD